MSRAVVITGMGWVTPLGHDLEGVWSRLLAGESAIKHTTIFDARTFPTTFSADIPDFDLTNWVSDQYDHQHGSRNTKFVLAAAVQAWRAAGLDKADGLDRGAMGVYLGSGEGPLDFDSFASVAVEAWDYQANQLDTVKWAQLAYQRMDRMRELQQDSNMPPAHVAAMLDLQGPNFGCLTACAASTQAIGEATEQIRRGDVELMVAGGTHSMIHPFGVTGFNRLTALSTRNDNPAGSARPFDRTRDGFVLGEGAGILILEYEQHALKRGAKILAEVAGYGSSADAFRITDIHETGRGGVAAMRAALADANLRPGDIGYISAHGTGTTENDKAETLAIRQVFGDFANKVPISSIKSMIGHLIAAAGAVEAITCILAIRDKIVPPTINYSTPDPKCDLDYVPNKARKVDVEACLSNSFGFGGQNNTLVIKAYQR